jgi:hypothetical protein
MAGAGLIAHVMAANYCDHLPLYRQSGMYARVGLQIDRSTMAGWVDQGDELLDPLVTERIAVLYAIEADIRGQPPDERRRQRQARAGPLVEELNAWLSGLVGRVSAKSELAGAIGDTLTRWQALTRYRDDGRVGEQPIASVM